MCSAQGSLSAMSSVAPKSFEADIVHVCDLSGLGVATLDWTSSHVGLNTRLSAHVPASYHKVASASLQRSISVSQLVCTAELKDV